MIIVNYGTYIQGAAEERNLIPLLSVCSGLVSIIDSSGWVVRVYDIDSFFSTFTIGINDVDIFTDCTPKVILLLNILRYFFMICHNKSL